MAVRRLVCFFCLAAVFLSLGGTALCQGIYIPPGASVRFFAKDTAAVFGDIQVNGYLGQDSAHFLYFLGKQWNNAGTASFNDKGIISFAPLSTISQRISGAYNALASGGVNMPILSLNNRSGLVLDNASDLSVRELRLNAGILSLNGSTLVVRNGLAALPISGYHANAFVATGAEVMGGFVEIKNMIPGKTYVWPVGINSNLYTPFAYTHNGSAGTIKARVFDNVYQNGLSGATINNRSTGTTYMLSSSMDLNGRMRLQHLVSREGSVYALNHAIAGVAVFNQAGNAWGSPETPSPPVSPGTITTLSPLSGTATTYGDINALAAGTYLFSSLVANELSCPQQLAALSATRLSSLRVKLDWSVQTLNNLSQMIIEKDVFNNGQWIPVDSLYPTTGLFYTYTDTSAYSNTTSAYRIRLNCSLGSSSASDRVLVSPPERASDPVLMYPNPATISINVAIPDYASYVWLTVYDLTGHMLIRQRINGPVTKVDVSALPGGTYNVFLLTSDNKVTGNLRIIKVN